MSGELKPCPFCGLVASVNYYDGWHVNCDDTEACRAYIDRVFATEEEAAEAWNERRTPPDKREPA